MIRMREAMLHRGPDDAGIWIAPDRHVGLAFRRLSIVDLSTEAGQPMSNNDETVWIVFNGEIYNHRVLRRQLEARGHRFRTDHADTEVILHGYEEWGTGIVDHLDGMFAFGIWDRLERRLFLARDRVGIKPLYFTWAGAHFLFASEIKSLLAHPNVSPSIEAAGLYHYLSFLTTPAPLTMFRGIYKMPAGHRAILNAEGDMRAERYWDPSPDSSELAHIESLPVGAAHDYVIERTRHLLSAAVKRRLMSDVPVGVFLSGGVDSSAIAALMTKHQDQPIRTFTVGFSDHRHLNELQYARKVANLLGTDHHEVMVDERSMREYLPSLVYSQDEPIADWVCIPLYYVSRLARDTGTAVVLVGEGSDEQFCGYRSYMAYLTLHKWCWKPFCRLPGFAMKTLARLAQRTSEISGRWDMYADIIDRAVHDREHFWGGAISFWEPAKRRILKSGRFSGECRNLPEPVRSLLPPGFVDFDSLAVVRHHMVEFDRRWPCADVLLRMIYLEFKLRLPELLLMRVDKITMSTSVEARVPFLDHRLVELSMAVPMSLKVKNAVPKYVLKKSCEDLLPDDIIYRKKMGFGAPMREWLQGEFGRESEETVMGSTLKGEGYFDYERIRRMFLEHRRGRDNGLKLWTLYNLTAWFDRWVARDMAP